MLIVDDDSAVRQGFSAYFSYAPDIAVAGVCSNGVQALDFLKREKVDVVLSDINMPEMGGIELLEHVKKMDDAPAFVAITALDTDDSMLRIISNGGQGYVVKSSSPQQINSAVRDATKGGTTVSPECLSRLVDYVPDVKPEDQKIRDRIEELTPAERMVLDLLCQGLSNAEIARQSYYAESTVKKHVSNLTSHFGASNRLELVVKVINARTSGKK
ncbi:response regulator [Corynebacterium tapiri]|uniref:Response regulator transcription factor n=1 Tax=Corynebacterium tapiri TaxID=1448266 RepID=A0A5C4U6P9_9CORY|nr:response regulator transcription factor [Corynebacterium tapiri]TNL98760.1 response regulator transcription factor [Corynebacterium tapiri]